MSLPLEDRIDWEASPRLPVGTKVALNGVECEVTDATDKGSTIRLGAAAKVTKSCRSFPSWTAVSLAAMTSRCPFIARSAWGLRSWKQIQLPIIN